MDRVKGKIVIISGGARGQGAAHGKVFAQEGARVLLGDVLDEDGKKTAAALRAHGYDVRYRRLDVSSEADWKSAVDFCESEWGKLDILINNAGIVGTMKPPDTEDVADWQQMVDINQKGVFLGIQACIPAMRRAGKGSIVNTSSMNGIVGSPGYFSYQASKGAVRMMTKSAALTYASENIRVNSVCPGLVMTPMALEEGEESNAAFAAATPLLRGAEAEEISWGVLYLASDEASYVTGIDLVIDGGYTAQ
jgi:NAD(P)-dependent dehydrogenase (short-subunit alcohol dehydrogenase family)